jgi:hypothetical protein
MFWRRPKPKHASLLIEGSFGAVGCNLTVLTGEKARVALDRPVHLPPTLRVKDEFGIRPARVVKQKTSVAEIEFLDRFTRSTQ